MTDPASKVIRYFYDSAGRMTKAGAGASGTTDPTQLYFDGTTGRMTKVGYTSGGSTSYANYYSDADGRLTKLTDWIDGTDGLRYAYDAGGRLTTLTDYDDSTLEYTYDDAGNVITMEDYHGSVVTYAYTNTNSISTVTAPGSRIWGYDYNAIGKPIQCSLPNGMVTVYGYDVRNRLTKIEHKDGANVLDGFYYAHEDGGRITRTKYQNDEYWDHCYDGRNRLTKAERRDDADALLHRYTYTFDAGDNMSTKEIYDGTNTYTYVYAYTVGNELTKQTFGGTDTTFAYDARGRMTSKSDGTNSAEYYYNYEDKLTKVSSDFPGDGTVEYEYGGDGTRRQRVQGDTTTWYNYDDGWDLLNEESENGTLIMTYVHDPAKAVGTVLADLAGANPATGEARYYSQDNIGSTRRVRDANKGSLGQYEYEPFGRTYSESGTSVTSRFTGHIWDDTSDLLHAPYRFYMAEIGRWIARDGKRMADGPNEFTYCRSEPIGNYDRLGLQTTEVPEREFPLWVKDGLYVCCRGINHNRAWHAYFWDPNETSGEGNEFCGQGHSSGFGGGKRPNRDPHRKEYPRRVDDIKTSCKVVSRDSALVKKAMECCYEHANNRIWIPLVEDCHSKLKRCLDDSGIGNSGPLCPGGRVTGFPPW
jgi:RHS repeat-associated protein